MPVFKLPDLGEGLPDAIIREWHVKPGDQVQLEQPLASMETAKALVDVPSPIAGIVETLHGKVGDTVNTGEPLVSFVGNKEEKIPLKNKDQGTVVGKILESNTVLQESATGIQTQHRLTQVKILPAFRGLALALDMPIHQIKGTGPEGSISTEDFKKAIIEHFKIKGSKMTPSGDTAGEKLSPSYRAMVQSMTQSHQEVVPVTLCDEVDIHTWFKKEDLTIKLIQAICFAAKKEPRLNAHFFSHTEKFLAHSDVNIGIAVDAEKHGLFVPVLKQAQKLKPAQIRKQLNEFKEKAENKSFSPNELKDSTILLSNFGSIAGQLAVPVLTPPCVAIIGAGRVKERVVLEGKKTAVHPILSISITADHRVITGGELARFLRYLLEALSE